MLSRLRTWLPAAIDLNRLPAAVHQLLPEHIRAFDPNATAKRKQLAAQVDIYRHGPGLQIQLHRIGLAGISGAWLQHVRCLLVVPPTMARQRLGEAGVLDWVALQALRQQVQLERQLNPNLPLFIGGKSTGVDGGLGGVHG